MILRAWFSLAALTNTALQLKITVKVIIEANSLEGWRCFSEIICGSVTRCMFYIMFTSMTSYARKGCGSRKWYIVGNEVFFLNFRQLVMNEEWEGREGMQWCLLLAWPSHVFLFCFLPFSMAQGHVRAGGVIAPFSCMIWRLRFRIFALSPGTWRAPTAHST